MYRFFAKKMWQLIAHGHSHLLVSVHPGLHISSWALFDTHVSRERLILLEIRVCEITV